MGRIEPPVKRMYHFPVENPISGDDVPRFKMPREFTVDKITALLVGGGLAAFDWEIRYSPNANDQGAGTLLESDTGTNNVTTGDEFTAPFAGSNVVPADDWIWMELSGVTTGTSRPVAALVIVEGVEG